MVRGWLIDTLAGTVLGGAVGAIVAVNVVIYSGIDGGYEATVTEVFRQNTIAGIVVVAMLLGGPITGIVLARRLRATRDESPGRSAPDRPGPPP